MVAKLPFPQLCSVALVGTVVQERASGPNAQYFSDLEVEWRQRVEQYLMLRGNPEAVPNWPDILENRARFLTCTIPRPKFGPISHSQGPA